MSLDVDNKTLITWLSPIGKICNSVSLHCSKISLLILFYYLTRSSVNKYFLSGLIIAALNPILFTMAMSGRGAASFFILMFIFYLLLFKNHIPLSLLKKIKKIGVVSIVGFATILFILTIARFGSKVSDISMMSWISLYLGEGVVNFNTDMWNILQHTQGDNSFSFFKYVFGFDTFTDILNRRDYWNQSKIGIEPWRFYTYLGDWFSDLGVFFTLLLVVCLSFFIRKFTSNKNKISFTALYLFVSIYSVVLCGFTIYQYKIFDQTLGFMLGLLLCCVVSIKFKWK